MNHIYTPGPGDEITWGPVMSSRDPRWDGDEFITEDDAVDIAREEALASPYLLAEWLEQSIDRNTECDPIEVDKLAHLPELRVGQLLVMLFAGQRTAEVIDELQDRYLADENVKAGVEFRAADLQKELAE